MSVMLLAGFTGCAGNSGSAPQASDVPSVPTTDSASGFASEEAEAELPQGAPPAVDWVQGNVLHRADGRELPLQLDADWGVSAVVRSGEDLLVTDGRWFEGTASMHRLRADGTRRDSWATTGPAVKAADGTVAWTDVVTDEGGAVARARIHVPGTSQQITDQFSPRLSGFVDGEVVYTARVKASGNRWVQRQFATDLTSSPHRVKALPVRVMSPGGKNWFEMTADSLSTSLGGHVDSYGLDRISRDSPPVWEDEENLLVSYVVGDRATLARITQDRGLERTMEWARATAQTWPVAVG